MVTSFENHKKSFILFFLICLNIRANILVLIVARSARNSLKLGLKVVRKNNWFDDKFDVLALELISFAPSKVTNVYFSP